MLSAAMMRAVSTVWMERLVIVHRECPTRPAMVASVNPRSFPMLVKLSRRTCGVMSATSVSLSSFVPLPRESSRMACHPPSWERRSLQHSVPRRGEQVRLCPHAGLGLGRCDASDPPGQGRLHLLEFLLPRRRRSGLRMDHLLVSPSIAQIIRAAGVDVETRGWENPRDHAPAWIDVG